VIYFVPFLINISICASLYAESTIEQNLVHLEPSSEKYHPDNDPIKNAQEPTHDNYPLEAREALYLGNDVDSDSSNPQAAEAPEATSKENSSAKVQESLSFKNHLNKPLYGQISGKKVRLRVAAQLDAPVIRELDKMTPLEIVSEHEDFYAVKPPFTLKAYVFRTYVLDNKIEGDKVNIRTEPSPQGIILTQLSTGYPIQGIPSSTNSKWLEIDLPESVCFYVSRDFVQLIDSTAFEELKKSHPKSEADSKEVVSAAADKKMVSEKPSLTSNFFSHSSRFEQYEKELEQQWIAKHTMMTREDYQVFLRNHAKVLEGEISLYNVSKTAPGDYILKNKHRVVAILYSPKIDLNRHLHHPLKIKGVERNNAGYAYPTYYVIEVE
jgi:hypothetical protein